MGSLARSLCPRLRGLDVDPLPPAAVVRGAARQMAEGGHPVVAWRNLVGRPASGPLFRVGGDPHGVPDWSRICLLVWRDARAASLGDRDLGSDFSGGFVGAGPDIRRD